MTINEMRKKVCERANWMHRLGMSKKAAFKEAWAKYKKEATMTKVSDLKQGDVITVEYGDYDNVCTASVISVAQNPIFKNLMTVKALCGTLVIEFCANPTDLFDKVA